MRPDRARENEKNRGAGSACREKGYLLSEVNGSRTAPTSVMIVGGGRIIRRTSRRVMAEQELIHADSRLGPGEGRHLSRFPSRPGRADQARSERRGAPHRLLRDGRADRRRFGPDVLALQKPAGALDEPINGGVRSSSGRDRGTLLAPPKVRIVAETDQEYFRRKQSHVAIRHVSDHRVVAVVEVVSPGNKSTRQASSNSPGRRPSSSIEEFIC